MPQRPQAWDPQKVVLCVRRLLHCETTASMVRLSMLVSAVWSDVSRKASARAGVQPC